MKIQNSKMNDKKSILEKISRNKKFWLIIIAVFAVLNILLGIFYKPLEDLGKKLIFRPKWYAVHLSNGQVYFGQLKKITQDQIRMSQVYYLEAASANSSQNPQGGNFQVENTLQQTYNLVKRGGSGLLLTDNVLYVNRSAVLFWEKLKSDSPLVQWIEDSLKK